MATQIENRTVTDAGERTISIPPSAPLQTSPAYQAYQILHFGFTILPIIAGVDKFTRLLVDWDQYLSPFVARIAPVSAHTFMLGVGVIEMAAGIIVAVAPRIGGTIIAFWLWGIIINLLLVPGYFDIALRDFGLSLGALALTRLAREFGQ